MPHLSRLNGTVQVRSHNVCFYAELTKIVPYYHRILRLMVLKLWFLESFLSVKILKFISMVMQ